MLFRFAFMMLAISFVVWLVLVAVLPMVIMLGKAIARKVKEFLKLLEEQTNELWKD